ncbi:hypothetical protein DFJ77DRAFT_546640 [Powellomyces hirtus]|nr:hypothetical protein DFJ77DRAFT_546640 [Powellomyces hirtus]
MSLSACSVYMEGIVQGPTAQLTHVSFREELLAKACPKRLPFSSNLLFPFLLYLLISLAIRTFDFEPILLARKHTASDIRNTPRAFITSDTDSTPTNQMAIAPDPRRPRQPNWRPSKGIIKSDQRKRARPSVLPRLDSVAFSELVNTILQDVSSPDHHFTPDAIETLKSVAESIIAAAAGPPK